MIGEREGRGKGGKKEKEGKRMKARRHPHQFVATILAHENLDPPGPLIERASLSSQLPRRRRRPLRRRHGIASPLTQQNIRRRKETRRGSCGLPHIRVIMTHAHRKITSETEDAAENWTPRAFRRGDRHRETRALAETREDDAAFGVVSRRWRVSCFVFFSSRMGV